MSLQRTGRLGTYATSLGQEAVAVGIASAMQQQDALFPSIATTLKEVTTVEERGMGIGKLGFVRSKHGEAMDVRRATKLSLGRLDAVNLGRIFHLATHAGELSIA